MKLEYFNLAIDKNGDPWFVAMDLCDVLKIKSGKNAVRCLLRMKGGALKYPPLADLKM